MNFPDDGELKDIEEAAIGLARHAGRLVLEYFGTAVEVTYKSKGKTNPVTTADKMSEALLKREISAAFPHHAILGEEGARVRQRHTAFAWVLDPLDGTTNFMNGLPIFAVSIGVLYHGYPVAAAIFVPSPKNSRGNVFHARRGHGAFVDRQRISVNSAESLAGKHLVSLPGQYFRGFTFDGPMRKQPGEVRGAGSIAYELAFTASGVFHYCLFWAPKIWDVAAGALLVQEAGGEVLVRRKYSRRWTALEHFGPNASTQPSSLRQLQKWRAAVIVGNPLVARRAATHIKRLARRQRR